MLVSACSTPGFDPWFSLAWSRHRECSHLPGTAVTDEDELEGRGLRHLEVVCGREGRGVVDFGVLEGYSGRGWGIKGVATAVCSVARVRMSCGVVCGGHKKWWKCFQAFLNCDEGQIALAAVAASLNRLENRQPHHHHCPLL